MIVTSYIKSKKYYDLFCPFNRRVKNHQEKNTSKLETQEVRYIRFQDNNNNNLMTFLT